MKNSRKLLLAALLFLIFSGLYIIPNANAYWYFYDLALLQLNNDSFPDVCVLSDDLVIKGGPYNFSDDNYFFLTTLVNADETFHKPLNVLLGKDSPEHVAEAYLSTGDLNNDGYSDAVVTTVNKDSVIILLQKADASGTFDLPFFTAIGTSPRKTAIGDLNEDGLNDIAVSGAGENLLILINDASHPGQPLISMSLNHSSVHIEIGDLNADLRNDIVLAGTDNVVVLFQDPLNPGNFVDNLNLAAGTKPSCVKIVDMDNDEFNDIVASFQGSEGTYDTGSIAIFYQDSSKPGTFLSPIAYNLSCEAFNLDIGDLNADGLLDMAVANSCAGDGAVKLFFQNKEDNRTFAEAKSLPCTEVPFALKISDMNQDGRNDIVVSDLDVVVLYQSVSIPGDFSESSVILESDLSKGGGGGGSHEESGSGCFIGTIFK